MGPEPYEFGSSLHEVCRVKGLGGKDHSFGLRLGVFRGSGA